MAFLGVTAQTTNKETIKLNSSWQYAEMSKINSGTAVLYKADINRKNIVIGINAGHGTSGGIKIKTYSHPDKSPKVTGGTNAKGAVESMAVSDGMIFTDGTPESEITLAMALILRALLLEEGFDVLMLRETNDVQLDNVARTVICNNMADCHIAIHWDGDGKKIDKGVFYIGVPELLKTMEPVKSNWKEHELLGKKLIDALGTDGFKKYNEGRMEVDLTQTSYSTIPSVDIELGNQCSDHSDDILLKLGKSLVKGIKSYFNY